MPETLLQYSRLPYVEIMTLSNKPRKIPHSVAMVYFNLKAPCRSHFQILRKVINFFSGLSFPKALWSIGAFLWLFKGLEAKCINSTKEIIPRVGDKHARDPSLAMPRILLQCDKDSSE